MKRVIICIGIMSLIIIVSLWGIFEISSLRKDFDDLISKSESLVLQQDLASAERHLDEFTHDWEAFKKKVSFVCVNSDLKDISDLVSQLEFQLYASPESYFESCIKLRTRILYLLEAEIPDIEGVF
ncbi:MAG: DUF4363 family protein [Ruminococcus sp.]|nr:DUF4363 family protein [Ruminococcus sp.]